MAPAWLGALRAYLAVVAVGNLGWEVLQLPLYTIWQTGTPGALALAVAHCTGGDILIALAALVSALVLVGQRGLWPVAVLAMAIGVAYTGFSEWLNVYVRQSWAYSERMPVLAIGPLRIGAAPILQWVIVPAVALWVAGRRLE
jgi:hypothetical protein